MRISLMFIVYLVVTASISSCVTTPSATTSQNASRKETNQSSLVNQGNHLAKDGLLREAVEAYKKALLKDPSNATAHRNLGIVLLKAGDAESSIINLEKSMSDFEENFDANFYLGEAYRAQDKYAEAIYRYQKALKIQEDE